MPTRNSSMALNCSRRAIRVLRVRPPCWGRTYHHAGQIPELHHVAAEGHRDVGWQWRAMLELPSAHGAVRRHHAEDTLLAEGILTAVRPVLRGLIAYYAWARSLHWPHASVGGGPLGESTLGVLRVVPRCRGYQGAIAFSALPPPRGVYGQRLGPPAHAALLIVHGVTGASAESTAPYRRLHGALVRQMASLRRRHDIERKLLINFGCCR